VIFFLSKFIIETIGLIVYVLCIITLYVCKKKKACMIMIAISGEIVYYFVHIYIGLRLKCICTYLASLLLGCGYFCVDWV